MLVSAKLLGRRGLSDEQADTTDQHRDPERFAKRPDREFQTHLNIVKAKPVVAKLPMLGES
jgi:hypothetical protein